MSYFWHYLLLLYLTVIIPPSQWGWGGGVDSDNVSPPLHQRGGGHNVFGMDPIGVGVKLLVRSVT